MGSIRFEEFIKHAREYWNVNTDPQMSTMHNLIEAILNRTESELTEADLEQAETALSGFHVNDFLIIHEYYIELVERKELGASNQVVQTLVHLIYRYYCEHLFPADVVENMTPQKFARYVVRLFTAGDISVIQERNYGKNGCKFIAEALADFGGYSSVNKMD